MTAERVRVKKARRSSRCPSCGSWIRPGNRIIRIIDRWVCVACAVAARQAQPAPKEN